MDPTLTVLIATTASAATAALAPLPLIGRQTPPAVAIGWASALAGGLMLGAAYLLMAAGIEYAALQGALGAILGIGFVWLTHFASGTEELELSRIAEPSELYAYQVMLINTLHSASEGVAIGAAMGVSVPFGIFVAIALAVHNVPEAMALSAVLMGRGVGAAATAGLAVVTNVTQILLAVVTFAVVNAAPAVLPWAIGFSFGSLVYLVLSELLPESYGGAGRTTIALVTLVAMGIVVLLGGIAG